MNDKINHKSQTENDKINDKINVLDDKILFEIRKNKYVTIPKLKDILDKSEPTIYRHLKKLSLLMALLVLIFMQ